MYMVTKERQLMIVSNHSATATSSLIPTLSNRSLKTATVGNVIGRSKSRSEERCLGEWVHLLGHMYQYFRTLEVAII